MPNDESADESAADAERAREAEVSFDPVALPEGITKESCRQPPTHRFLSPLLGDEVEVHYVGTVFTTGFQFDSTRARSQTVKFRLGSGKLPSAWEVALRSLKKGEVAKFTMPGEHAFAGAEESAAAWGVLAHEVIVVELEIVSCPLREDLFEDGGVIRRELKSGPDTNGRNPRSTDEVQLSYKVTVAGEGVVGAARHGVYQLGSGALGPLSQAADKALGGMKRSDEVVLRCQPKYAFGPKYHGKFATVTLILEEIYEVLDVSFGDKNRSCMKKRIREGDGKHKVQDSAKVTLRIDYVTAGGEKVIERPREISFVAGNGEVCDALECSVTEMKDSEEAIIRIEAAEYAASSGGLLALPAGLETPVIIRCGIVRFEKLKEKWDMTDRERIDRCRERKDVAARLFREGRIRLCAQHYERMADFLSAAESFRGEEEQKDGRELRRIVWSNKAMCMLKLGNPKEAKTLCDSVIKDDPDNVKARFRRATAQLELKDYDAAANDLNRVLELDPSNGEGKRLLQQTKRQRKANDQKASNVFAKMCEGLGNMDDLPDRTTTSHGLVTMPDMDAEIAKIRQNAGLPPLEPAPVGSQAAGTGETPMAVEVGEETEELAAAPLSSRKESDGEAVEGAADEQERLPPPSAEMSPAAVAEVLEALAPAPAPAAGGSVVVAPPRSGTAAAASAPAEEAGVLRPAPASQATPATAEPPCGNSSSPPATLAFGGGGGCSSPAADEAGGSPAAPTLVFGGRC